MEAVLKLERFTHRYPNGAIADFIDEYFQGNVQWARDVYLDDAFESILKDVEAGTHQVYPEAEDIPGQIENMIHEIVAEALDRYKFKRIGLEAKLQGLTEICKSLKNEMKSIEDKYPEIKEEPDALYLRPTTETMEKEHYYKIRRELEFTLDTIESVEYELKTLNVKHFLYKPNLFETKEEYIKRIHANDGPNGTHRILPCERDVENSFNFN